VDASITGLIFGCQHFYGPLRLCILVFWISGIDVSAVGSNAALDGSFSGLEAVVRELLFVLLALLGILLGQLLAYLPGWFFLTGAPRITKDELRSAAPTKAWVADAIPVAVLLWFLLGGLLVFTTDTRKEWNWFLLPLVVFALYYLPVSAFELTAGVSVLMPFGKVARSGPALFIVSSRALPAGAFRLLITVAVVIIFLAWR
jgi:hypothetical protein